MKKTLTLLTLCLSTAFNFAYADTYDATLSGDGYIFSNSFSGDTNFDDYVLFTTEGMQNIVASISGTGNTSFSFTTFDLVDSNKNLVKEGLITNAFAKFSFGALESTQEGQYFLHVVGSSSGNTAGYAGTISLAAAVPEPTSVAMLLSGLGILGLGVSRRKKSLEA